MILFSHIFFISLGTMVGLISKNVMETSIIRLPILIIFSYGSLLSSMFDRNMIKSIISYLPTENFSVALTTLLQDGGFTEIKWNLLNILIWIIGSVIAAVIIYGKRRFDK